MTDDLTAAFDRYNLALTLTDLSIMSAGRDGRDLTFNDIMYLNLIYGLPDCTASVIADTVGVARSSVTVKINELCRKGYVVRTKNKQDGRVYNLSLAPTAAKLYLYEKKQMAAAVAQLQSGCSAADVTRFCAMLDTITEGLRTAMVRDRS